MGAICIQITKSIIHLHDDSPPCLVSQDLIGYFYCCVVSKHAEHVRHALVWQHPIACPITWAVPGSALTYLLSIYNRSQLRG